MQKFTTEKPSDEDRPFEEFELDGVTLTARKPKTAAFIRLIEMDDDDGADAARGVMDFVNSALTAESRAIIVKRLDDPDDDLDVETLVPVVNWLIESFTATERPTGPSSESSPPRKRTGRSSTEPSPSKVLTPSTSPLIDS